MTTKQQRAREHNWLLARSVSALAAIKSVKRSTTVTKDAYQLATSAEITIEKMLLALNQRVDPTGKIEFDGNN